MPYCTITDIQNRAGGEAALRAFDRDGDGTVDTAAVNAAIAWADAIIDSKLAASHGAPFTGTPPVVVRELSIDLALYRVASGYPGATGSTKSPYRQGYEDAMALLRDLGKDRAARLPTGTPEPFASGTSYVSDVATPFGNTLDAASNRSGF